MGDIGKKFINKTKKIEINESDQKKGFSPPPLQSPYSTQLEKIDLIKIGDIRIPEKDITQVINKRKSVRSYLEESLTLEELSYLLWCTQGVKKIISNTTTKRIVPSAGSRHPLETYLVINRVKGLPIGLYRYLSLEHKLLKIKTNSQIMKKIVEGCNDQQFIGKSALIFIWSANIYRMKWRHGERAYRYIFLDAGHVGQNLYLAADVIDCGVCAISVFLDDEVNHLVGIDGKNEFVIYMAAIGKSKPS
jgi:SagB-type dehydrogenase family enzyme